MKSKKVIYEKQLIRKKMISLIIYGLIFLVSTVAYYFVNTSKAKNVVKVKVAVMDKNTDMELLTYDLKAEEDNGKYKAALYPIQNGFIIKKYKLATENEFEELKKEYDKKHNIDTENKEDNKNNADEKNDKDSNDDKDNKNDKQKEKQVNQEENKEQNKEQNEEQNEEQKQEENKKEVNSEENKENKKEETKKEDEKDNNRTDNNVETNEKELSKKEREEQERKEEEEGRLREIIKNSIEIELTSEQIEEQKLYIIAEYDVKEVKNKKIYNKAITKTTKKASVNILGYMPENSEISLKEKDIEEVKNVLKTNFQDVNKEINLIAAYDIKILSDEKEYEPEDFDEKATVLIKGFDDKKLNIWHIKNDGTIELMEQKEDSNSIEFETEGFSTYAIEVIEDNNENKDNAEDKKEESTQVVTQIENLTENENTTNTTENNNEVVPKKASPKAASKGPMRAAARNLPDSTLEINDYQSDYYYYKGKNYTDNASGTNSNTYTDSNLVRVTLNYYGFAQGETDNEKKGRISLDTGEEQDIVKNIRCAPVVNGTVTLELMENPFMDKPTGYGFGGWTASTGTVTKNTNTLTYSLAVNTSTDVTVNLYAKWEAASVVYVNGDTGNDNMNDGLTEETPFGSWGAAFQYLSASAHNKGDREKNIIVVTGNIDSSINYTRTVTKTVTRPVSSITYNAATSVTAGITYILSDGQTAGANAVTANGSAVSNTVLPNNTIPIPETGWNLTATNRGYYIQNAQTGLYLASSRNGTISMSSSRVEWRYSSSTRRFYYAGNRNYYLRINNGTWSTTTTEGSGTQFYFVTYTAIYDENGDDIVTLTKENYDDNDYYASSSASVPVTVTSLYNHTDYRQNATIDLTETDYDNFEIYKAFQMNHVKINAEGYTSNASGTNFSANYPWLIGYINSVRLGRGIICANTGTTGCTFANVIGGEKSDTTTRNEYKIIVESGKYSNIQGFNRNGQTYSYYGTVYLTLGNDIDRKLANNNNLSVYYRTTINSGSGYNGTNTNEKAFLINVKSGKFGVDFFDTYINSTDNDLKEDCAYSGIYMGGYGTSASSSTRDRSHRYMIVEGGLIANAIGGLKVTNGSNVYTRMYIKGGEIYNAVGGAGVSTTYEDRYIQVTGGTIRYSINGGSNGVYSTGSGQDGKITSCDTLVYIGGNAQIGTASTVTQPEPQTLYEVHAGCVLGAGNGNSSVANSGQVDNTHIIINDEAHILNSVYGGGNYGIVGASGSTSAKTKIEILGGTIDGNVYGGANQNNIYGSTSIDVKAGQVKGAIYGGSNSSGTISSTTTINVTGGTLGDSSNTTANEVLFGGGYGTSTVVTGNAIINILDTDGNVNIYGSAYGGSSQGRMNSNVTVNIQDLPSNPNTISIVGNVFAGGKGTTANAAIVNGNATMNVDGSNIMQASVFGGNDINGTTNGNITVNIGQTYESKVLNVYGGGNLDATGTEADTVKVYLLSHANVTNAFNGGKSADLTTGGNSDTTRAIYLQGGHADNIFGGSDSSGTVTASHVYIDSGTATNVYGGNNVNGQTTTSFVYIRGGTSTNVYGGGYQATTPTTNVSLTAGTITNGFGGGNAANVTTANIVLNGTNSTNIYGGSNSSGTVNTSNVTITSGTATNVYGGNNAGGNTVNTNVTVNSQVTNVFGGGKEAVTSGNTNVVLTSQVEKIYGGGDEAQTTGNTYLRLTNAKITVDAYGGGNGVRAVVIGNSTTLVEGTTEIQGDLFGGGNAAQNGSAQSSSLVTTLITGGDISGDVYGAANTSVVNGNTVVKIGKNAVNDSGMADGDIHIGGTVFGGGKSNTAGSESYDFTFESVTGDAYIDIDAGGYNGTGQDTLEIDKSIFGSGNAAKISGYGIVTIKNYGTASDVKENISIQRASRVILDNCHMYLKGTTDTTNEIATAVYTFNRIDDLILRNNTVLYLESGVNIVSKMQSQDSSGNKEVVRINDTGITQQNVNNKIYLLQGKNIILRTEAGTDGEVYGMAFVGIFKGTTTRNLGMYADSYVQGSTITEQVANTFSRNSFVQGKHYTSHNIQNDGFYTNYNNEGTVKIDYIIPTPEDATYYQWIVGRSNNRYLL